MQATSTRGTRKPIPKLVQVQVFEKDRWLCRWCLRPVVFPPAMRLLQHFVSAAGHKRPLAFHHPNWRRDLSPLLDELGASVDHVHPHARGGTNDPENLATICAKCNVRKGSLPADEHLRRYKRVPVKGKHGEPQRWDGLASVFVTLLDANPSLATASEKAWANALKHAWTTPDYCDAKVAGGHSAGHLS